jgi:hypothetical protein
MQRFELRIAPRLGSDGDARLGTGLGARGRERGCRCRDRAGVGLDHQQRVVDVGKRPEICGQQISGSLALLPLEDAVEDDLVGRDGVGAAHFSIPASRLHDVRQLEDRRAEAALEDRHVEVARQPHLHDVAERGAPLQRHRVGLPHRHADRVAQREREATPLRRDPVEDVKIAGRSAIDQRLDQLVADLSSVAHQVDRTHVDACRMQRVDVATSSLTVAGRVEQMAVVDNAQVVHESSPTGTTRSIRARTSSAVSVFRQRR